MADDVYFLDAPGVEGSVAEEAGDDVGLPFEGLSFSLTRVGWSNHFPELNKFSLGDMGVGGGAIEP